MSIKLPDVNCKYGAPMGRFPYCKDFTARVRLFKVRLDSGGYDSGGAYWGIGTPLYCVYSKDEVMKFYRAKNRQEAKEKVLEEYPEFRFYR